MVLTAMAGWEARADYKAKAGRRVVSQSVGGELDGTSIKIVVLGSLVTVTVGTMAWYLVLPPGCSQRRCWRSCDLLSKILWSAFRSATRPVTPKFGGVGQNLCRNHIAGRDGQEVGLIFNPYS